ncbi:hypothetical protein F5148DRAFT_1148601 [Russula earlei]|uniref:Uncharacterized protein n=1 Tax=Russula earlei TaxID=71964 RepID=A0ACC0UBN6_9AGAM|nr:hypothetical protein F5148DRAFT_1148601 [Russula earlei]
MSNQYAHVYQQQPPQLHPSPDYSRSTGQYPSQPQPGSQPLRSSHVYPQPTYQIQRAQPLSSSYSPVPVHFHTHAHQDRISSQAASSYYPISAPSPQYPQQLPGIPHVGYSSPPTSPVSNGISRRPLPTPGAPPSQFTSPPFGQPLPTPGPTPAPASPQSHSRPLHPGSLPSSGIIISSQQPVSCLPSASPTSPTSGRRPLPLPRVAPGSSSDAAVASSNPAKEVPKTCTASPGGSPSLPHDPPSSCLQTKFVPYWKRTLPDPSSDRAPGGSHPQEAVSSGPPGPSRTVASPGAYEQQRDRSKSFTGGRPLPPSPLDGSIGKPPLIPPMMGDSSRLLPNPLSFPAKARTSPPSPIRPVRSSSSLPSTARSSPLFSTRPVSPTKGPVPFRPTSPPSASSDDDGKASQKGKAPERDNETPSPQYGILDLPPKSRSAPSRQSTKHVRNPASSDEWPPGRSSRSSTLPNPPLLQTQSSHRSTRSATVRSAPVFTSVAESRHQSSTSTPASPTGWPNTLPRPPRAAPPRSSQEYVNLDDAPPPSLRRSPSPSALSHRAIIRMKARSMASKSLAHDPPVPPRRSAASVPSSPDKTFVTLPQDVSATKHQGARSPSITPASGHQPLPERPRAHPPPVSRHPPSAFSQRFASGKPASAEPQVTTTRGTISRRSSSGGSDENHNDDDDDDDDDGGNASIIVSEPELPQITFSDPTAASLETEDNEALPIDELPRDHGPLPAAGGGRVFPPALSARRGGGLACGGCGGPIVGRIVSAMGVRWHPGCFRCSDCSDLLEYVSSYERDGKPYCHFDYHERFAPRCYHCKTPIVDERFITLDDPELGKRTYHEQHFFCSECGDPFLAPSIDRQNAQGGGGVTFKGDGEFENDDVGFTVYKGYPYCSALQGARSVKTPFGMVCKPWRHSAANITGSAFVVL